MICKQCNENEVPSYRKFYCDNCAQRKEDEWHNKTNPPVTPVVPQEPVKLSESYGTKLVGEAKPMKAYPKDPIGLSVEVFVSMVKALEGQAIEGNQIMALAIQYVKQAENAFP